jgi:hypothetical protein
VIETDPLARGRAHIERRAEGLRIEIPMKRDRWLMTLIAIWVSILAASAVTSGAQWETGSYVMSGAACVFILALLGWLLRGREVVTVTPRELVLWRGLGRLGKERRFARDRIERLRPAPHKGMFSLAQVLRGPLDQYGLTGGTVVFDYGARTHAFGSRLDDAETLQLVELMERELGLTRRAAARVDAPVGPEVPR